MWVDDILSATENYSMKIAVPRKYYLKSIGIILFIIIVLRIDFNNLLEPLRHFDLKILLLTVPFFFVLLLMKTYRWLLLVRTQGISNLNFYKMYLVYLDSYFAGSITPGRIGEMIKYKYISSLGNSFLKSIYSVIVDRLFDVIILFSIGYIGIFYFSSFLKTEIIIVTIFLFCTLLFAFIVYFKHQWFLNIFTHVVNKYTEKNIETIDCDYVVMIKETKKVNLLLISFFSLIAWMLYYFQMFLFARELNINISYLQICLCISISSLFALIPISVSGIGTRDAVLIFLFSALGLPKEEAISLSLMILVVSILNIFFTIPFWLLNRNSSFR